jgi:sulfopyruvate decarboxylase beta subunit
MNNAQSVWNAITSNNVDKVCYLPCNKLNALMQVVPDSVSVWNITKESVGLGLCFGRSLAGKKSAMLIQNTGLGNLITELYTMQKLYQEALPIFVSWRGYHNEPIEAQIILGGKIEDILNAIDVEYSILKSRVDIVDLEQDLNQVYSEGKVKVYLMSPELWETNNPDYHVFGEPSIKPIEVTAQGYQGNPSLIRIQAIAEIMEVVSEQDIVISQIGFPSKELYNTRDRATNFYMLGALGSATEVGIGLALEKPDRHVYVIDGDGSFFFNPNQLIDIASYHPDNLSIICLDNGSWGSTGNQPTLSAQGMNLSAMIGAMGVDSRGMTDESGIFKKMLTDRLKFIHYMIKAGNDKVGGEIPLKALEIKNRFMDEING